MPAPYFIRNLVPRRERSDNSGVIPALKSLTLVQWAQFWSG